MKQSIELQIPGQLAMLCELLEITPQQLLQGFINDLSLEVHYSNGSDERRMAGEYFMRVGYGMHRYSFDQVEQMFEGLNWLRLQWPGNDKEKEKQYLQRRKGYLKQWFQGWESKQKKQ